MVELYNPAKYGLRYKKQKAGYADYSGNRETDNFGLELSQMERRNHSAADNTGDSKNDGDAAGKRAGIDKAIRCKAGAGAGSGVLKAWTGGKGETGGNGERAWCTVMQKNSFLMKTSMI